jgi:hypothetical protein
MARCEFNERARSLAEREVGCPLDHCPAGHHVNDPTVPCPECTAEGRCTSCGGKHDPEKESCEEYGDLMERVSAAEAAAGWDPSP